MNQIPMFEGREPIAQTIKLKAFEQTVADTLHHGTEGYILCRYIVEDVQHPVDKHGIMIRRQVASLHEDGAWLVDPLTAARIVDQALEEKGHVPLEGMSRADIVIGQYETEIAEAIRRGDFVEVIALVHRIALADPDRAETVLEVLRAGVEMHEGPRVVPDNVDEDGVITENPHASQPEPTLTPEMVEKVQEILAPDGPEPEQKWESGEGHSANSVDAPGSYEAQLAAMEAAAATVELDPDDPITAMAAQVEADAAAREQASVAPDPQEPPPDGNGPADAEVVDIEGYESALSGDVPPDPERYAVLHDLMANNTGLAKEFVKWAYANSVPTAKKSMTAEHVEQTIAWYLENIEDPF